MATSDSSAEDSVISAELDEDCVSDPWLHPELTSKATTTTAIAAVRECMTHRPFDSGRTAERSPRHILGE